MPEINEGLAQGALKKLLTAVGPLWAMRSLKNDVHFFEKIHYSNANKNRKWEVHKSWFHRGKNGRGLAV